MTTIVFIPIDNRPVCYTLAQQIASIDNNLRLLLPPRGLLGDLTKTADTDGIIQWLKTVTQADKVIVSLDTIAYGGLIPSRRSTDGFEAIKKRMEEFRQILSNKNAKIYAFSSIMRISNNNINEEEKDYWSSYGKKIFQYSYEVHKNAPESNIETDIPQEILQDYLKTRKRNFDINLMYLDWAKDGIFDTLVFSKDDCAQYGLNVAEAQALEQNIKENNINAFVKTGADEIPLSLLARAVAENKNIKIAPVFMQPEFTGRISKYEDVSVFESAKGQIELAGCKLSDSDNADIIMLVNNFKEEQGELVMGVDVPLFNKDINLPQKPFLAVDILNANGADNNFVNKLLEKNINTDLFLGYAGWNTTGNTLGSALCCALTKYLAAKPDTDAFKKLQMIRFLDDWAYQANVRKKLKSYLEKPEISALKQEMEPFEQKLNQVFETNFQNIKYSYPWHRFFEIEVDIENQLHI